MVTLLENIVIDSADPAAMARFWAAALPGRLLDAGTEGVAVRLDPLDGPLLDLCFERVTGPGPAPPRLHLDLNPGADQQQTVRRLLGLGASYADIGQGDVPWVVLADIEGNAFCVLEDRPRHARAGPIAALPLDVDDPERLTGFWAAASGWVELDREEQPHALRFPTGVGPGLELCEQLAPKAGKNAVHLDVRVAPADAGGLPYNVELTRLLDLGARRLEHDWGELPWTVLLDPSGNEFCLLPAAGSG